MDKFLFAERLKDLLIENDLKPTALANLINCKRPTVYRYLNAIEIPTLEMSIQLANLFNCTMENLLGLEIDNYTNEFLPCPPFNEQFKYILKYFGVTKYKLCKTTGIAESAIYYWANGKTQPSLESIVRIAEYLNCPIDFVIGRTRG